MFFLRFNRNGKSFEHQIDSHEVINNLVPFGRPDKSGSFKNDAVLLVQCVNWNTSPSILEPAPLYDPQTGISMASWARIDNRDELANKLSISRSEAGRICDSELILKCYLKWQGKCVDHLIGDFVFVIYDEKKQKIFCGRDHMGVRPFYYHLSDNRFFCATSLNALIHIKDLPIRISTQWIVEYLTCLSMSFDGTPYEGIYKLPPAHTLSVTSRNHNLSQYFKLSAEPELKLKDSREYVDAYREQLETAIKCRLNTTYALGSELSGGLDSSTITAYTAKFFEQPLTRFHTFAFAYLELEPQYIMTVSQACGLPYNYIFTGRQQEQDNAIKRSLKILGYPVEHGSATFHEPFYLLAEKFNIRTLLSGFGGDEFGTTIHGYMVPMEMILKRRYRDLFNVLPGNVLFRFLRLIKFELRKIKSHNFTQPEYNARFYEAYNKRWPHQIVGQDMVAEYNLKQRYFDQARFDAGYTDLKRFTLENRWAPFVTTRMENCTLMAAARKIEYRWPLLDVRLVKLFLSIPSEENYFQGMSRYLHRRAIDGVVPELVTWKKGKDMGNIVNPDHFGHMGIVSTTDLHKELTKLIDVKKLNEQITVMAQSKFQKNDDSTFQFIQNGQAIKKLNQWLRQDLPDMLIK
jgi:asparagine synthase (glutamine-hydrolysing)